MKDNLIIKLLKILIVLGIWISLTVLGTLILKVNFFFIFGVFGPIGVMTVVIFYWITSLIMGILSGVIVAIWIKESNDRRRFYGILVIFSTVLLLMGYYLVL
ncbi:hypothetical protein HYT18_01695 [Candidatus Microgenomates bacterium]|nr:hypothetical protein [Candidatus Microgenomates bacterium]